MKKNGEKVHSITSIIKFITGILSWVILVILVLIAGFLLYYFVSVKIYAQKGEEYKPSITLYTILTQSMEPNIKPNDVIIDLTIKNPDDIQIGDIITFTSTYSLTKGMVITHRVIDKKQEGGEWVFYTKGDANLSPEPVPTPFANIHGKVLIKIPQLGLLQKFLATKGGWLIVVVIPALIIIISDVMKLFRLQSTKNQVDLKIQKEQLMKQKKIEKKERIKEKLVERYTMHRHEAEPNPIPKKNYKIVTNKKENIIKKAIDLPKKIDLPKRKNK